MSTSEAIKKEEPGPKSEAKPHTGLSTANENKESKLPDDESFPDPDEDDLDDLDGMSN